MAPHECVWLSSSMIRWGGQREEIKNSADPKQFTLFLRKSWCYRLLQSNPVGKISPLRRWISWTPFWAELVRRWRPGSELVFNWANRSQVSHDWRVAQSKGSLPRSARKPAAGNLSIATFVLRTGHCLSSGEVGGKWRATILVMLQ